MLDTSATITSAIPQNLLAFFNLFAIIEVGTPRRGERFYPLKTIINVIRAVISDMIEFARLTIAIISSIFIFFIDVSSFPYLMILLYISVTLMSILFYRNF